MDESLPPSVPPAPPAPPFDRVVIAVGVALLTGALSLSTVYTRNDSEIDWTNYLVGIAATLVLLGIAGVTWLRSRGDADLVSWPGALGIVGVGLMLGLALDDSSATPYVMGLVVLALSVGAYVLNRGWTFVLAAIGGFGLVYGQIVDDLFDAADLEGDNFGMLIGVALLIFTALVTAATWFLPERELGGVVAGTVAAVGNFLTVAGLAAAALFRSAFGGMDDIDMMGGGTPTRFDRYDNDVWVILVLSLVLIAGWAWCAWQTGHVGFRVLIVATCSSILPVATLALAVEHPSWWGAIVGVLGTGALGWLVFRALRQPSAPQG